MAGAGDDMIGAQLMDAVKAYDDQALATLANAGLLRRAQRDLDNGKVMLKGAEGDTATIEVDGHTVAISTDGPAKAACTCPAPGVCRHRIAAVLFLRTAETGEGEAASDENEAEETPADPADWIAEITLDQARKFAGRPGWRAALEIVGEAKNVEAEGNSCGVSFTTLEDPVLILRGQGMAGIVSKATKARKKAYHAAALLAARKHLGLEVETAEDEALLSPSSAAMGPGNPAAPDAEFLATVQSALVDCAQLGFNLAPLPIEERLFELSVSSRADALPRLAALLRSIASQMRLRRQSSFDFDASTMLELSANAFALTFALRRDDIDLAQYLRFAGELRRNYAEPGTVELVGCGADLWRSGSGARGVTAHFMHAESGEFYSVAMARGAGQDPGFIPRQAFRQQALWNAGTMETLCHSRILLHNAGIADGGRLSSNKEVQAEILEKNAVPAAETSHVYSDWGTLQTTLADRFKLGVDASGMPQMAMIQPAEVARPQFDELAQQLVWPIRDASGQWIALTMDHDERSEQAIAELEKQLARRWKGTMLIRAFQTSAQLKLSPVTLFDGRKPIDLTLLRPPNPWGAKATQKPDVFKWLQTLLPDPGRALTFAPPSRSAAAVMEAWRHILDRLEAGPKLARMLDDKRAAHAKRLADYGMSNLAERVAGADDGAGHLIAAYALLIARQQRVQLPLLG